MIAGKNALHDDEIVVVLVQPGLIEEKTEELRGHLLQTDHIGQLRFQGIENRGVAPTGVNESRMVLIEENVPGEEMASLR